MQRRHESIILFAQKPVAILICIPDYYVPLNWSKRGHLSDKARKNLCYADQNSLYLTAHGWGVNG